MLPSSKTKYFFLPAIILRGETTVIEDYGGFGVFEIAPPADSETFIERDSPSGLSGLTDREVTKHIGLSGLTDQISPSGLTEHGDSPNHDARYAGKNGPHVCHDVAKKKGRMCAMMMRKKMGHMFAQMGVKMMAQVGVTSALLPAQVHIIRTEIVVIRGA